MLKEIVPNQNKSRIMLDHPLINRFRNQKNLKRKKIVRNQKQPKKKRNASQNNRVKKEMMKEKCFYNSLIYRAK